MKRKTSNKVLFILSFVLLIALLVVLKYSSLPTLKFLPENISHAFEKPAIGSVQDEVFRLLENLSLAYLSAFIVYLLIEFLPDRNSSKTAFLICRKNIQSIYSTMSYVVAPMKMLAGADKEDKVIVLDDLKGLDEYVPEMESVYYVSKRIVNENEGAEAQHIRGVFLYHHELGEFQRSLNRKLEELLNLPVAGDLDYHLIEIISEIWGCEFLTKFRNIEKSPLKGVAHGKHDMSLNFYDFLQLYLRLEKYDFVRFKCSYTKMEESAIPEFKREREMVYKNILCGNFPFSEGNGIFNGVKYVVKDGELLK